VLVVMCHRIAIDPTENQEKLLRQAVGVARFAYNWALAEWKRQYEAGHKPNEAALRRQLNAVKRERFPWMSDVPKSVPQQAVKNLGTAFQKFFRKETAYPRFKKKGIHDSARFDNGPETFKVVGNRIRLPKVGWLKLREGLRFSGRPLSATVSREADRWFVSVPVEIELPTPVCKKQETVGIDLGITTAATLSSGEKLPGPKALSANLKKLRLLSRRHARKLKGSANSRKSKQQLARLHARIAHVRQDWLHKLTTRLCRENGVIAVEDLNVRGMMANEKLARHSADIGMHEFRRQLEYKSKLRGVELVIVDRWYPSSKLCSICDYRVANMPLSLRSWLCPSCGSIHDRDINAAANLRRYALNYRQLDGKLRLSDTMPASKELRGRNQTVSDLGIF